MQRATRELARTIPNGEHRTLAGETRQAPPEVIAPIPVGSFTAVTASSTSVAQ